MLSREIFIPVSSSPSYIIAIPGIMFSETSVPWKVSPPLWSFEPSERTDSTDPYLAVGKFLPDNFKDFLDSLGRENTVHTMQPATQLVGQNGITLFISDRQKPFNRCV